jgi:hypothetical protein
MKLVRRAKDREPVSAWVNVRKKEPGSLINKKSLVGLVGGLAVLAVELALAGPIG